MDVKMVDQNLYEQVSLWAVDWVAMQISIYLYTYTYLFELDPGNHIRGKGAGYKEQQPCRQR